MQITCVIFNPKIDIGPYPNAIKVEMFPYQFETVQLCFARMSMYSFIYFNIYKNIYTALE